MFPQGQKKRMVGGGGEYDAGCLFCAVFMSEGHDSEEWVRCQKRLKGGIHTHTQCVRKCRKRSSVCVCVCVSERQV